MRYIIRKPGHNGGWVYAHEGEHGVLWVRNVRRATVYNRTRARQVLRGPDFFGAVLTPAGAAPPDTRMRRKGGA